MKKYMILSVCALLMLTAFSGCGEHKDKSTYVDPDETTQQTTTLPVTSAYDDVISDITPKVEEFCKDKALLSDDQLEALADEIGCSYRKNAGTDNNPSYLFQYDSSLTLQVYTATGHHIEYYIDRDLYKTDYFV